LTIFRLIAPQYILDQNPDIRRVLEGVFTPKQIKEYNKSYNIYYLPNHPKEYTPNVTVDGSMVDQFNYVFVDCDLKDKVYTDKDHFIETIANADIPPTKIVDSGNGVHVYWKVTDLDAMSYLRFQRRLMRLFNTDEAVGQLFQLMRYYGTNNIKYQDAVVPCELLFKDDSITYTSEELNKLLPQITQKDEDYCQQHYNKTYNLNQNQTEIDDTLPPKFGKLLRDNQEAKDLYAGNTDDRSKNDYRLGHLLLANGFTKDEALSVLVNSAKALQRAPVHRKSYAENIVNKIWTFELTSSALELSSSVEDILIRSGDTLQGERFPCYKWIDNTETGFRLGHVMGLVAGSGVGKTTMALNLFKGFVASNPEYDHFFIPLEQTDKEIAHRWKSMCGDNVALHKKVHIISNYDEKGTFRDLSLETIKNYILEFQKKTNKKVGCVVIDHIGILCNTNKLGQDEGVKQISKAMKGFAVETNTFLIMQSQTAREKAGIGDLELNKDAAFGTSVFENFCDYLVTLWQPLKRVYPQGAPTVMAYKFCKIRHKNQLKDVIKEDVCYTLFFDPATELVREMTQENEKSFNYFLIQATNKRKADRKTELVPYKSSKFTEGSIDDTAKPIDSRDSARH
jgi:KaiC/GvpD/RAD55 family RecA-like ATPase